MTAVGRQEGTIAHAFNPLNGPGPGWFSGSLSLTLDHYRFAHAFDHLYGAYRRTVGVVAII